MFHKKVCRTCGNSRKFLIDSDCDQTGVCGECYYSYINEK